MKHYMRLRDVIAAAKGAGISERAARDAVRKGVLPKVKLLDGGGRAHYRTSDVERVFGIGPGADAPRLLST